MSRYRRFPYDKQVTDPWLIRSVHPGNADAGQSVDIVVVSYNCLAHLKRCIGSIRQHADLAYTLLVVDNASTDGTREYLNSLPGATVILNTRNWGYARACNQGANAGQGRYILLLNADTAATPGWLSALVRGFQSDSQIAVVGPKLVDFQNRIVSAGVIGSNASPRIRGWMKPDDPGLYARPIDCLSVSGAAYMIRRDLIPVLGLFDESYFFYYEETDYSYNARRHGYRVVYWPYSRMYHAVSGASGNKSGQELRQMFSESERYFRAKWADFLKEEREYGDG